MGNYAVRADIEEAITAARLLELTDDEGDGSQVEARTSAKIADAEATVDGYLQKRYTVPLSPVPSLIKVLTVDIAVYALYGRTMENRPEARKDRYDAALKLLRDISDGRVSLGVAAIKPVDSGHGVTFSGDGRTFTRDGMKGVF